MNRQVGYIAYAYMMLAGIALGCYVISKIPHSAFEEENAPGCGTVDRTISSNISDKGYMGKALFQSKCASCHAVFKDITGPKLADVLEKEPWTDRKQLYKWIRNPEAFMKTNAYTRELKKQYGSLMTAFGDNITDDEIDAIFEYVAAASVSPS
jgi:mono/diheme cytochrome c family protein